MESSGSCKFSWAGYCFKIQYLLFLFFGKPPSLLFLFFFFHGFPDLPWDCPVVDRYVLFFALLLVNLVVLTNVHSTRGVMECLLHSETVDEVLVSPVRNHGKSPAVKSLSKWRTDRHVLHHLPTAVIKLLFERLNLTVVQSDIIVKRSSVVSLRTAFSSRLAPLWWSLRLSSISYMSTVSVRLK